MNTVYDKRWSLYQIVMILVCILAMGLTLLPVISIVATSLSGRNAIAKGIVDLIPRDFTTEACQSVFDNRNIVDSMFYSLALTLFSGFLSTLMTILAAYSLSKTDLKGHRVFMAMTTITMCVSAGTVSNDLMVKNLKLINTVWALVVPALISPFNLIIPRSFFLEINKSLFEAAYMEG